MQAVRVEAVAQRGPGDAGFGEQLLGGGMVARRAEWAVGCRALVARVEDAPDPGRDGGLDRVAVQCTASAPGRSRRPAATGRRPRTQPAGSRVGIIAAPHSTPRSAKRCALARRGRATAISVAGMRSSRWSTVAPLSAPVAPVTMIMTSLSAVNDGIIITIPVETRR